MSKEIKSYFKLGLLVLIGTGLLVITLYLIGSKRNIFSNTINITADFYSVNGLIPGNNVRYGGIDVGTVEEIIFKSDTVIEVKMAIQNKLKNYIKNNSIASIGTDGLVGNKLVSITYINEPGPNIKEGDRLKTLRPLETEDMMRTLNQSNQNLLAITNDLKGITTRLNQKNNLFDLLNDKSIGVNIKQSILDFKTTAEKTTTIANNANSLVLDLKNGKGLVGSLLKDTSSMTKLKSVMTNVESVSYQLKLASTKLDSFSNTLNTKKGLVYTLMRDTALSKDLKSTIGNLNESSKNLNENMKALQSNWFFRGYFKKKEKAAQKAAKGK